MKKILMLAIISTALLAGSAYAGNTHDPKVNTRQHIQKERIVNGVLSGELTKKETKKLYKQQKAINRLEKKYKSDGKLTKRERHRLDKAQDRASRNIYRKKHNNRSR